MTIARFVPLACALLAACARGEPPHWTPDGATSEVTSPMPSLSIRAAVVAAPPDAAVDAGAMGAPPDAGPSVPAPQSDAGSDEDPGSLPQTHDMPKGDDPAFLAGAAALVDAIAHDDPKRAMPFFFPLAAYKQVKDVGNPAGDWRARLVAAYQHDIHELHEQFGPRIRGATFAATPVPVVGARWVQPGEEYNRIGYYRVFNTKLYAAESGAKNSSFAIPIKSMISWRGRWYCVHLARVR